MRQFDVEIKVIWTRATLNQIPFQWIYIAFKIHVWAKNYIIDLRSYNCVLIDHFQIQSQLMYIIILVFFFFLNGWVAFLKAPSSHIFFTIFEKFSVKSQNLKWTKYFTWFFFAMTLLLYPGKVYKKYGGVHSHSAKSNHS